MRHLFRESMDSNWRVNPSVYIIRGADGSVLYIGATEFPAQRLKRHRKWVLELDCDATYEVRGFCGSNMDVVRAVEKELIHFAKPRMNKQWKRWTS